MLWAQRLLPHGDLCRVPHRVPDPATVLRATFLEDVDYDDAALEEMLYDAHRERVYHSQREGLSVGQSSSSVSDRSGQPVVERGQELNTEHAQIRTLLDRQREQILADCQAEIKKHELQANYDRRSKQKLSETIESQQEELHRAQAEELQRRDQQLLHAQLLQQNWDLREGHDKILNEMEELKKFQSSTFDTIARRRLVEDQDTILELTGKIQELQNEINCMNDSRDFQRCLDQYAVDNPTLPVNQRFSHFFKILVKCYAVLWESSCVLFSTLPAGIESMEFRKRRTDSLINGGKE